MGRSLIARKEGLYFKICAGTLEFLVTPLLMGPASVLSQGRFEEPSPPLPIYYHILHSSSLLILYFIYFYSFFYKIVKELQLRTQ